MNKNKLKQLKKTHDKLIRICLTHDPIDGLNSLLSPNLQGYGTAEDEVIYSNRDFVEMIKRQKAQVEGFELSYDETPIFTKLLDDQNIAILVNEYAMTLRSEDIENVIVLRLSNTYEYRNDQWQLIQFHGSTPDADTSEGEAWPIEEWKRRNEELEKRVAEQTFELKVQKRALEIEVALERVRARTMAMHQSKELSEVVQVVYDQLQDLGICNEETRLTIGIINEETGIDSHWTTRVGGGIIDRKYNLPLKDFPYPDSQLFEIWKNTPVSKRKELLDITEYKGASLRKMLYYVLEKSDYSEDSHAANMRDEDLEEMVYCVHEAWFSHGNLILTQPNRLNPGDAQVLKRFASVFEQAYIRFLDLEKAEAQAREAQIEAALERVRAASMAMHNSDELPDVALVFTEQIELLGIPVFGTAVNIINQEKDTFVTHFVDSTLNAEHKEMLITRDYPTNDFWMSKEIIQLLKKGRTSFSLEAEGEKIPLWIQWVEKEMSKDRSLRLIEAKITKAYLHVVAFHQFSHVLFSSLHPLQAEHWTVIKRMAQTFALSYTRFLDLQKAETQARESQIEAALERVRAKTMAMHNSEDIGDTVTTFFKELLGLGLHISIRCGVGILSQSETMDLWTASAQTEKAIVLNSGSLDMTLHPLLVNVKKSWKEHEQLFTGKLTGENMHQYFEAINNAPDYPAYIDLNTLPETVYQYSFNFKDGILFVFIESPLEEAIMDIFHRFAAVFGQTYTRYLDLQKAEAREMEARKQSVLDRVRAEIASMRSTKDLEDITPLIWKELVTMNVPFIRCGVFIMDEEKELVYNYLSTPDGQAIASFQLPFNTPGLVARILKHWKKEWSFLDRWDVAGMKEFADILVSQGIFDSPDQYLDSMPKDGFYLHFLPFLQGMLYVGNTQQLGEDDIDMLQSLAETFSTAYARYEDFNNIERAKKQVEETLTDLKQAQQQLIQSEKMASLGELTAGIAHEIKNPLNFVNNFSELNAELIDELEDEIEKGDLEEAKIIAQNIRGNEQKIAEHGKRADGIVQSMLQHSRGGVHERVITDINALCDEYIRLAYHGLRARDKSFNAEFETDFDPNLPKINVIPQDIGRVLLNLINNAFQACVDQPRTTLSAETSHFAKASSDKSAKEDALGLVTVSTHLKQSYVQITISDNGPGIPEKIKEKIFQPFFTTKPAGQGTGLGLSLAYDIIVKGHGGKINVESKEGRGTTFSVVLPVK